MSTPCTITKDFGVTWLDGRPYIGITKVLRAVGTSPLMMRYKLESAMKKASDATRLLMEGEITDAEFKKRMDVWEHEKEDRKQMLEASEKGKQVHSMVQAFADGDSGALAKYKAEVPTAYSAFDTWLVENGATIEGSEVDVFHGQLGLCGRFDARIRTAKGSGIYEIKSTKKVYFEHLMQASFYALCDVTAANNMKSIHECDHASVLVIRDGRATETVVDNPASKLKVLSAFRTIFEDLNPDSPIFKASKESA